MTELLRLTVAAVVLSGTALVLENRFYQEDSIYGAADCNGCAPDPTKPWITCDSPYGATDNTCDFNGCTAGNACGNGTVYTGAWTFNYIQFPNPITLYSSTTSLLCTGKINCAKGAFNAALTCTPGFIQQGQNGNQAIVLGKCAPPNPGANPTGCATCSNGGLDLIKPVLSNLNVQSCGWCPDQLPDPEPGPDPTTVVQ
jgi:hypothetical protein